MKLQPTLVTEVSFRSEPIHEHMVYITCHWISARLQYLKCVSNGDTAVLHWAIDMKYQLTLVTEVSLRSQPTKELLVHITCGWVSATLQYLQCVSNGDTAVLHLAINMKSQLTLVTEVSLRSQPTQELLVHITCGWVSATLQYLQCVSNGDIAVLH